MKKLFIQLVMMLLPPVIGFAIPVYSRVRFVRNLGHPEISVIESGYQLIGYLIGAIPFICVSVIISNMLSRKVHFITVLLLYLCILVSLILISGFGYLKYETSPFALAFLPLVNMVIVLIGWIVSKGLMGEIVTK